jgi:hypothetical protein
MCAIAFDLTVTASSSGTATAAVKLNNGKKSRNR